MMRFQHLFASGLATALVLPHVASQDGAGGLDIDGRIVDTARAIEELGGLVERLRAGDRAAVEAVLVATEPAQGDPRTRDGRKERLRREVAELYERVDGLGRESAPSDASGRPAPEADAPAPTPRALTRGLGNAEREALRRRVREVPETGAKPTRAAQPLPGTERAFEEDPSYSADAVRQARLHLRLGQPADAIGVLVPHEADPEARYWLARAYEAAELYDEALERYDTLAKDPEAGVHGTRAGLDRDFLRVKRELARGAKTKGSEPR